MAMKRTNSIILALALLFVSLFSLAVEKNTMADGLHCQSVTGCCGAAGCDGPGSVNGCKINCARGGDITCATKGPDGKCGSGDQPSGGDS
jgi:hypothetical protein